MVMVYGPVGSGKSTLLRGMLGAAAMLRGDGALAGRHVAFTEPATWLLNASVADNVYCGRPADEGRLWAALRACQLEDE
eukprot:9333301-Pyramimonas_sp.AAC.1